MNETIKTLLQRRTVRTFNDKPVPQEVVEQILQAGLYAPSARGEQNAIFVVIQDKETLKALSAENARIMGRPDAEPFYGAKTVILVVGNNTPNVAYDGSCAIDNMLNAAWSLGVGTCWIHRARQEVETEFGKELLKKAGLPDGDYVGVGHIALGYFDDEAPEAKPRKDGRVYFIK